MPGVCCLNILCSGTVAARVDRVSGPTVLILGSVNLYNFPKIQKTQTQMLNPHYFCGFLVSSGPLAHGGDSARLTCPLCYQEIWAGMYPPHTRGPEETKISWEHRGKLVFWTKSSRPCHVSKKHRCVEACFDQAPH